MNHESGHHDIRAKSNRHLALLNRLRGLSVGSLVLLLMLAPLHAAQAGAAEKSAQSPEWIYPVIPGVGGVHPRPNLPVRPDPKVNYRIFVDMVSDNRDPAGQYEALVRLARLVNLMAYAKVPSDHVHIVALLDGKIGFASANNAFYQKAFHADNPNLPIVHALKKAGVELMVCSQGLAENNLPDSVVDPDVTVTLSALTDAAIYGQKGYIYMQL
ncbi:MAG: DsrE family protein [Gammaproteobacteria bacterium]|jgi:intracellular sulfur oxidation DsrE/DsrF family protein